MGKVATGFFSIIDNNDGVSITLSRASAVVPSAEDGSAGDYSAASATASVYIGGVDDSANWTFQIVPGPGISGAVSAGRTYTVTNMTGNTGYIDFIATKQGFTQVIVRFTVVKAPQGRRGSIQVAIAIAGTSWSDATAGAAIANAGGGAPISGDVVTQYNSVAGWSQTRVHLTNGTWAVLAAFFGGDVLVDGTLVAAKLAAGSITAEKLATETLITSTAQIANGIITNAQISGQLHSNNYASGSTGWMIGKGGNAEFNNLIVRGSLQVGAVSDIEQVYLPDEYNWHTSEWTQRALITLGAVTPEDVWTVNHMGWMRRTGTWVGKGGIDVTPALQLRRRVMVDGVWEAWTVLLTGSYGAMHIWARHEYYEVLSGDYDNVQYQIRQRVNGPYFDQTQYRRQIISARKITR